MNKKPDTIQPDDVRHFIHDRTPDDNPLAPKGPDLFFSDEEIERAMRFMVMEYNQIPPLTDRLDTDCLPAEMFLIEGVVAHLLKAKVHSLARKDFSYEAGGASFDLNGKQLKNLQQLAEEARQSFFAGAKNRKLSMNVSRYFRII